MLPHFYFNTLVKRRFELFEMDVLDLALGLDNALRAGMALPQAIDKITGQMHGVMKEELEIVQREYRLGINLVQALERLHRRMPSEDVRLLVSAIRITSDAGGSLSDVLKEMSAMIRGRREFKDKLKTLTAEGRFEAIAMSLAPLAAFAFMYLIQPELMRVLYTTTMGWCSLGAVAVLDVLGYIVIRKIVSIEV
jgi:tight adherence protein B